MLRNGAAFFVCLSLCNAAYGLCGAPKLRVDDEYFQSEWIFTGTPIAEKHLPSEDDWEETVYTVRPDRWFRGHINGLITLKTENNSGRFYLEKGKPNLIFMQQNPNGDYLADGCGHTDLVRKSGATLKALQGIPHHGKSYLYGGCINGDCAGGTVRISGDGRAQIVTLDRNGKFIVKISPGTYQVSMATEDREWQPYDFSYHAPAHVVVLNGGSAGVSFMELGPKRR